MSVAVDLADLPAAIAKQIGWCYLLTVSDEGQPRVLAVVPEQTAAGSMRFDVGKSTAANVGSRPDVTLLFPPATPSAMSLIVDGTATIDGSTVELMPTWAVMHRSAIRDGAS
jgi:hypothetical protein